MAKKPEYTVDDLEKELKILEEAKTYLMLYDERNHADLTHRTIDDFRYVSLVGVGSAYLNQDRYNAGKEYVEKTQKRKLNEQEMSNIMIVNLQTASASTDIISQAREIGAEIVVRTTYQYTPQACIINGLAMIPTKNSSPFR